MKTRFTIRDKNSQQTCQQCAVTVYSEDAPRMSHVEQQKPTNQHQAFRVNFLMRLKYAQGTTFCYILFIPYFTCHLCKMQLMLMVRHHY